MEDVATQSAWYNAGQRAFARVAPQAIAISPGPRRPFHPRQTYIKLAQAKVALGKVR